MHSFWNTLFDRNFSYIRIVYYCHFDPKLLDNILDILVHVGTFLFYIIIECCLINILLDKYFIGGSPKTYEIFKHE